MHPIFGKVIAESSAGHSDPLKPFLFRVHGSETEHSALHVIVTDSQSNTFQAIKTRQQLEDLRDDIGVGGSWPEFVDYVTSSLKSGEVRLIVDGSSESEGTNAKLIAQKAKGMPRISISLCKLVDGAAGEAMAKLSLDLFKEFKEAHTSLIEERESKYQLTKILAAEQEKNDTLQKQLDGLLYSRKAKSQKIIDRENTDATSFMVSQDSPEKHAANNLNSARVAPRVVPAHRRSRVRGVVLDDNEDDAQN